MTIRKMLLDEKEPGMTIINIIATTIVQIIENKLLLLQFMILYQVLHSH